MESGGPSIAAAAREKLGAVVDDVSETKLVVADNDEAAALAGSRDENLRLIEQAVWSLRLKAIIPPNPFPSNCFSAVILEG